jgi:hypothetical protein
MSDLEKAIENIGGLLNTWQGALNRLRRSPLAPVDHLQGKCDAAEEILARLRALKDSTNE